MATEHSARFKDPKDFEDGSFRRGKGAGREVFGVKIPNSIIIIFATPEGSPNSLLIPQSLKFPEKDWTAAEAQAWLKKQGLSDNVKKFTSAEKESQKESVRPERVDVFWTQEDPPVQIIFGPSNSRLRAVSDPDEIPMLEATVDSGIHQHPHEADGIHDHLGLPEGGNHVHNPQAFGAHFHREGDPLEGFHINVEGDDGSHQHLMALAQEVPGLMEWMQAVVAAHFPTYKWIPAVEKVLIEHKGELPRETTEDDFVQHLQWFHSTGMNQFRHRAIEIESETQQFRIMFMLANGGVREQTIADLELEEKWFDENLPFPVQLFEGLQEALHLRKEKAKKIKKEITECAPLPRQSREGKLTSLWEKHGLAFLEGGKVIKAMPNIHSLLRFLEEDRIIFFDDKHKQFIIHAASGKSKYKGDKVKKKK